MSPAAPSRWERLVARPGYHRLVVALAVLLALPTLGVGFYSDDLMHVGAVERLLPWQPPWYDLYRFTPTEPAAKVELIERGVYMWWTEPSLRVYFLRPLTSALFTLDHALFGREALGYHAHTIAWYAALVAVVGLFYRRVVPGTVAGVAVLLFAIDESHAQPVAWIACRHLVFAAAPSFFALYALVRWREDGPRAFAWLAALGLAIGLSASESALGAVAYGVAYAWLGPWPRRPLGLFARERLVTTLPMVVPAVAHLALYKALGCGVSGIGAYLDPARDPLRFAEAAALRAPVLAGDSLLGLTSDFSNVLPIAPFVIAGLLAVGIVATLLRAILPLASAEERAALRWLVPGAVASLLPTLGGFPGSRLLMFPSLGGAALLAVILRYGLVRAASGGGRARRFAAGFLFVAHVAFAPVNFLFGCFFLRHIASLTYWAADEAARESGGARRVYTIGSDPMATMYAGAVRIIDAPETLDQWSVLSLTKGTLRLTRVDASTLALDYGGERFLQTAFERVYRAPESPFHDGDVFHGRDYSVRVVAVDRGAPTKIEVRFATPLDDPARCILAWQDGRFRRLPVTDDGASIEIPWSPGPTGFF
jgi:hypothetical protein